jgi:hypothetical protein
MERQHREETGYVNEKLLREKQIGGEKYKNDKAFLIRVWSRG